MAKTQIPDPRIQPNNIDIKLDLGKKLCLDFPLRSTPGTTAPPSPEWFIVTKPILYSTRDVQNYAHPVR
jgi:hypothetical protein